MPAPELLPAFLLAVVLVCAAPGPDLAFVVASGIGGGPRAGAVAAVGMSAGMVVHTALAGFGLAALFQASPGMLDAIRVLGALYLLHLAATTWRSSRGGGLAPIEVPATATVFRRALITNLANVKVVLFFAAFLPQFVRVDRGSPNLQFAVLGLLFLVVGLAIDLAAGLAAGKLRAVLASGSRVPVLLDRLAAGVFAGVAVMLLVDILRRGA